KRNPYPHGRASIKIGHLSVAQHALWGPAMAYRQSTRAAFAVCVALLGLATARGDEAADKALVDRQLADALRDMHNRAADLFNGAKDYNGAYRMFQGGLYVVRPLLNHRTDVQQILDSGMQEAERLASLPERAMRLHR